MKRDIWLITIVIIMISILSLQVFANDGTDPAAKEAALEKLYGVQLSVEQVIMKDSLIYNHVLNTIEQVYCRFPKGLIKEVTDYYKKKGINTSIKVRYYYDNSEGNLETGIFSMDGKSALLTYRVSGDWSESEILQEHIVAHDVGRLIHRFIQDKYGDSKFKVKWQSFNGSYAYGSDNDAWNALGTSEHTFARYLSTSSYIEDIATTIQDLIAEPDSMRARVMEKPDSPLAKKIKFLNEVLEICSDSIAKGQLLWDRAEVQTPSAEGKAIVEKAFEMAVIPREYKGLYNTNISLYDYSKLTVAWVERKTGMEFNEYLKSIGKNNIWYYEGSIRSFSEKAEVKTNLPYIDVDDNSIFDLYSLNAFSGIAGKKYFNPGKELTREEAAAIAYAVIKTTEKDIKKSTGSYSDSAAISSWAKDGVDFMTTNKIMLTVDGKNFGPKEKLTYEQAYIMMQKLWELYSTEKMSSIPEFDYLVEPKYERANLFSDGMALVLRDNKYFYIDKTGKEVISLPYAANDIDPGDFHEGVALIRLGLGGNEKVHTVIAIDKSGKTVFKLDNVYGYVGNLRPGSLIIYSILLPEMRFAEDYYIDTKGHKYSYKEYGTIYDFNADGLALFKKGQKFGVIDKSGRTLLKAEYSSIEFLEGGYMLVKDESRGIIGEWAVVDKNGRETVGMGQYKSYSISDESLIVSDGKASKLLDFSGKVLYEGTGFIDSFSEGLTSTTVNGDRVIIDTLGREVFRYRAESSLTDFEMSEGLAAILKGSRWIIIDKNFTEVAALKNNSYALVDPFKGGMAAVGTYNNKWGFIDKNGEEIVAPQYKSVEDFSNGLAIIVSDDYKYGVINKSGKVILEPVYESVETGNGLIAAKKDGIHTLMDDTGKFILKSENVIGIDDYGTYGPVETLAFAACIDDKTGKAYYINKVGDRFDEISDAGAGITKTTVRLDAGVYRYGFCNSEGKIIAPPVYYHVSDFDDYIEGAAILENTDHFYGVIDKEGKVIIPFEYKYIGEFTNGIAHAQKIKHGYIDEKGNMVVPFIYDSTSSFKDGFAIIDKDGKFGFIKEMTKK